jgi:hypothetical protein
MEDVSLALHNSVDRDIIINIEKPEFKLRISKILF